MNPTPTVALVTGASRGIGHALANALSLRHDRVVVAARTLSDLKVVANAIPGGHARELDMRDDEQVEEVVEFAASLGNLKTVVANASALIYGPIREETMRKYDLVSSVNVRGTFALARSAAPHMVEGGHFVAIAPPVHLCMGPMLENRCAHLTSKLGMTLVAMSLAQEEPQIRSNALWPETLIRTAATEVHGIGRPEDWREPTIMADALLALLRTQLTGEMILDTTILRADGVTDFRRYSRFFKDPEPAEVVVS